jgi:hypothetical protein
MVQLKATRMWDFYSDLDHCNALDVLRLQETYDLRGGVATTEQKTLQLRRFFFTAVESIARGTLARETGNAAAKPPTNVYPAADEAHVMTFLRRMLSKHPSFDSIEGPTRMWSGRHVGLGAPPVLPFARPRMTDHTEYSEASE